MPFISRTSTGTVSEVLLGFTYYVFAKVYLSRRFNVHVNFSPESTEACDGIFGITIVVVYAKSGSD